MHANVRFCGLACPLCRNGEPLRGRASTLSRGVCAIILIRVQAVIACFDCRLLEIMMLDNGLGDSISTKMKREKESRVNEQCISEADTYSSFTAHWCHFVKAPSPKYSLYCEGVAPGRDPECEPSDGIATIRGHFARLSVASILALGSVPSASSSPFKG